MTKKNNPEKEVVLDSVPVRTWANQYFRSIEKGRKHSVGKSTLEKAAQTKRSLIAELHKGGGGLFSTKTLNVCGRDKKVQQHGQTAACDRQV